MKLAARLRRHVGRALKDFAMIAPGDVVVVGVSGGKDSYALLDVLLQLRARSPVPFEVKGLVVDQGFSRFEVERVEDYLEARGVECRVETIDTLADEELFGDPTGSFCSFCARQRRGVLWKATRAMGGSKLALGHHREDVLETLLMNMFFNGRMRGMPARLAATGLGKGLELIRPLVYVPEELLVDYAREQEFPITPCGCPTCGTSLQKRQWVKQLLGRLEGEVEGIKGTLLTAMKHVDPEHMLAPAAALAAAAAGEAEASEADAEPPEAGPPPGAEDEAGARGLAV